MTRAIGGYFELADYVEGKGFPHSNGILLNTGRNSLEYILRGIGDIKGIYLPYYTCEVVLQPLKKLHIPWAFYHINAKFEMVEDIHPQEGEYIIANNYFGIKDSYIQTLAEKYGDHLIVDCAQAFFAKPIPGIKAFYSARKFVGVADGGIAFLGNQLDGNVEVNDVECTVEHDKHLLIRKLFGAEAGFAVYQSNEKKLDSQPIRLMSSTTERILNHIDYDRIVLKRRENFAFLHERLKQYNYLQLPTLDAFACPMVYPLMIRNDRHLREELINNRVFVAKYWPNIRKLNHFEVEYDFAEKIVAIPCDQRYGVYDMKRIIDIICSK